MKTVRFGKLPWIPIALFILLTACGPEPDPVPTPGPSVPPKAGQGGPAVPSSPNRPPDRSAPPIQATAAATAGTPSTENEKDAALPRIHDYFPKKRCPVDTAPVALYQLLKAGGHATASYTRLRDAWTSKPRPVDLAEMKAVLEAQGVTARITEESLPTVLDAGQPAVILVGPGGANGAALFTQPVLCLGRRDRTVHMVDPTCGSLLVSENRLASLHGGRCLRVAPPTSDAPTGAPDLFVDEILWHYGAVPAGSRIHHSFRIRNRGTKPLLISHVETTCGCAAAVMNEKNEITALLRSRAQPEKDEDAKRRVLQTNAGGTIPAGESRWITAYVDTLYKKGERNFGVRFRTNDPEEPEFVVILAGEILQVYELEPQTVWFQDVNAGQGAEARLWLRHRHGKPIKITELVSSDPSIALTIDPDPPRSARRPKNALEARLIPSRAHPVEDGWVGIRVQVRPDAPVGTFSAILHLTVDGLPLEASASGRVRGHLTIKPRHINLGRIRRGETASVEVTVTSHLSRSFQIDRIETSPSFVQTKLEDEGPGEYRIRVSLTPGWDAPRLEGRIVIHSNDPLEPRKAIHVFGFVTR